VARGVVFIAALTIATVAGTALTVGVYSARWEPPEYPLGACVLVAVVHLVWCGGYVLLSESVFEDAVKSAVLVVTGCLGLYVFPLLGLLAISAAVSALAVHQVVRWVRAAKQRHAEPGAAADGPKAGRR
jgi:hypothetical protein